jgi:hypothetical protein
MCPVEARPTEVRRSEVRRTKVRPAEVRLTEDGQEENRTDEIRFGLSPCRYPNNWLVSAGKEGRHETGTL